MPAHGIATLVADATQPADVESPAAASPAQNSQADRAAVAAPAATPPGKVARFGAVAFAPTIAATIALTVHR